MKCQSPETASPKAIHGQIRLHTVTSRTRFEFIGISLPNTLAGLTFWIISLGLPQPGTFLILFDHANFFFLQYQLIFHGALRRDLITLG